MSHKYPFMKNVSRWIREGKIPEDLDIEEVIKYWVKNHERNSTKRYDPWKNKPRFYNRALTSNSRAKKLGNNDKITADDLEKVFTKYGGKCAICDKDSYLVFDHVIPYYRGGRNIVDNLQLLCRLCNMEKGVN